MLYKDDTPHTARWLSLCVLVAARPALTAHLLVAVSGRGHHRDLGDLGLRPRIQVQGFDRVLARAGVEGRHDGDDLAAARGEARQ